MLRRITHSRATMQVAIAVLGAALIAPSCALAGTHKGGPESQPINLSPTQSASASGSSGSDIVRTIVGLAIVLAVIWGLTWVLRRVKSGRETKAAGTGLASMATLPLGSGRSVALVRAGKDYVLVGVAEHGVIPIHRYSEAQAREAGLLDLGAGNPMLADETPGAFHIPGQPQPQPQSALERLRRWTVRA